MWNSVSLATTHALLLSIGEYPNGITPLTGVKYDVESARKIARALGVKDENILQFRDSELTLAGMRKAFETFSKQVGANDEVFIYYSGHGGRSYVKDPDERCAESLVTYDGENYIDAELSSRLTELSAKTRRLIVFLDACHSGGVTTRGLPRKKSSRFTPKYWSKGQSDACGKPTNIIATGLEQKTRSLGTGTLNYVYIAAARDNEVSLDEPGKGGLATQEWVKCMSGAAADLDGSGALTADEIRKCAQVKINKAVEGDDEVKPHHISVLGNADAVLMLKENQPQSGATNSNQVSPYSTLKDIYNSRDDRRIVTLQTEKNNLQIGKDNVKFSLSSTHAGYVYLLMVGSDGKAFDLIFPNSLDKENFIESGESLNLPASNWQIVAQGPKGTDHLLAIVSDARRDFSVLGAQPAGPFSVVDANITSAKNIQQASASSAIANSAECQTKLKDGKQNKTNEKKCSDAYGAAILDLNEVTK
jgi:hypothetical protein